jgi:hypothetical protein
MIALGWANLAWLPPLVYTISCMMFGYPSHGLGYYWWAVIMESTATTGQLVVVGVLFACAVGFYTVVPRQPRLTVRSTQSAP